MRSICVVGRTYEQAYPQKLGREFCGNNILDSGGRNAVDKRVLYLSIGFLGEKKLFRLWGEPDQREFWGSS